MGLRRWPRSPWGAGAQAGIAFGALTWLIEAPVIGRSWIDLASQSTFVAIVFTGAVFGYRSAWRLQFAVAGPPLTAAERAAIVDMVDRAAPPADPRFLLPAMSIARYRASRGPAILVIRGAVVAFLAAMIAMLYQPRFWIVVGLAVIVMVARIPGTRRRAASARAFLAAARPDLPSVDDRAPHDQPAV
jgi:hypothetical protein